MKRLLVVEDDRDIREIISLVLSAEYIVQEAADGEAALRIIAQDPIDLIVLDMQMPVRDGEAVIRELRLRHVDVPVIVISAHVDLQSRARELGAAAALAKPFSLAALESVVAAVLASEDTSSARANGR
jgi:DNA-binding response OmpR family regulator